MMYVAGPDDVRGNGTQSYLAACSGSPADNTAASEACGLLKRPKVRARMREIREEGNRGALARLRSWLEMAPAAQTTLEAIAAGTFDFPKDPDAVRSEKIRSARSAAEHILDRALGTVRQMHEHQITGGIIVGVAGPAHPIAGELEEQHPRLLEAG